MDKLILNSQKKFVFELITQMELEPSNFYWTEETSRHEYNTKVSCLKYVNSNFFFKFDFSHNQHSYEYSPGEDRAIVWVVSTNWLSGREYIIAWLKFLKREINITNPWDEIEKYIPGEDINLTDGKTNDRFSFSQVDLITKSLNRLGGEIKISFALDAQQMRIVQNKLDYLIDRAQNIGRIDWKNIFIATIIGVAFQLAMDAEQTKLLWHLVKTCFSGVLLLGSK